MILIINKSNREGNALADAFKYMGIVAKAESAHRAMSEISTFYRLVIIVSPESLPDEREYVRALRSYLSIIPIMALTDNTLADSSLYDFSARKSTTTAEIYKIINNYFNTSKSYPPGEYLLLGLDASASSRFVTNHSTVIPLTKTERMVLRTLIRAYPIPLSPKDILKYAFSQSKLPDPTSIRTYICGINKKFNHRFGRKLVVSLDGGYAILTPELAQKSGIEFDYHNELSRII